MYGGVAGGVGDHSPYADAGDLHQLVAITLTRGWYEGHSRRMRGWNSCAGAASVFSYKNGLAIGDANYQRPND